MVRLVENGQEVKMSKRLGNAVTIRELCDEVGVDAARVFLRAACARYAFGFSILGWLVLKATTIRSITHICACAHVFGSCVRHEDVPAAASYARLTHEKEVDLMKYINEFTGVVSEAARLRAPHKVCNYIQKLAQKVP